MDEKSGLIRRVIALFSQRKTWVRQITVAGLAGATAWQVGDLLIKNGGVVAAIVCALSIRISLHKSLREGLGQIVGTAIGASVALTAVALFDFGFISVGLTIIMCAVVARALHLGEVASINVPVTALIVISPGLPESTALHRLGSTLIGAAIAIFFSYFSHHKTPIDRSLDQIKSVSVKAAALLATMSEGVASGYTQKEAGNWLAKARLLNEEIPNIRSHSVEARGHARWFSTAKKDEAEEIYIQGIALEHTVVEIRTIARTLFDSAVKGGIADSTQKAIAVALSAASFAISSKFEDESSSSDDSHQSATTDAREAGSALAEALISDAKDVDQEQIVRGISMVANIELIADSLDLNSPSLRDVASPDEPASAKVLKISLRGQINAFGKAVFRRFRRFFGK
ncbi:MAG: FUSC family protein [Candidatus Planktophila sp.]|nr:FUSC family protein [Candidatus Planktophila sp.]